MKRKNVIILAVILFLCLVIGLVCSVKNVANEDDKELTRAQWIQMLCERFGIPETKGGKVYFEDVTIDNEAYSYVQTAVNWEILEDTDYFYGDNTATGEFMALTAMKAIGDFKLNLFLGTDKEFEAEEQIQIALDNKLIEEWQLKQKFTKREGIIFLENVMQFYLGDLWKDDYAQVEYQDNVIVLDDADIIKYYDYDCVEISEAASKKLQQNMIVVLRNPATGILAAGKYSYVNEYGVLYLDDIKLEQVIKDVTISDVTTLSIDVVMNNEVAGGDYSLMANGGLMTQSVSKGFKVTVTCDSTDGGTLVITSNDTGVSWKKKLDPKIFKNESGQNDCKLSLEVEVEKTAIGVLVDYNIFTGLECFDIQLDTTMSTSANIEMFDKEIKIPLFESPLALGNGVIGVEMQYYLVISADGTLSIKTELPMQAKVLYTEKKGWQKFEFNYDLENPTVNANCTAAVTGRIEPIVSLFQIINIVDIEVDAGTQIEASTKIYDDLEVCIDTSVACPVITVQVCGDDDVVTLVNRMGLSAEWEIISAENALYKDNLHYETYKDGSSAFVEECTRIKKKQEISTDKPTVAPTTAPAAKKPNALDTAKYYNYDFPIMLHFNDVLKDEGDYYSVKGKIDSKDSVAVDTFDKLKTGEHFISNGNEYIKGEMLDSNAAAERGYYSLEYVCVVYDLKGNEFFVDYQRKEEGPSGKLYYKIEEDSFTYWDNWTVLEEGVFRIRKDAKLYMLIDSLMKEEAKTFLAEEFVKNKMTDIYGNDLVANYSLPCGEYCPMFGEVIFDENGYIISFKQWPFVD